MTGFSWFSEEMWLRDVLTWDESNERVLECTKRLDWGGLSVEHDLREASVNFSASSSNPANSPFVGASTA